MRVALFTDNDFDKVNGVTTTLKAVLKHASGRAEVRIFTAANLAVETPEYFAASAAGMGLPWYRDMRIYWPPLRAFARELRRSEVDVIHVSTPGPVGLAGRLLGRRLGLPVVGSYHTHLGDYAHVLSGSARLGQWMESYVRWFYGACARVLVPSKACARTLEARGYSAEKLRVWSRGVDTEMFAPSRASADLRRRWKVDSRRPAVLYVGRLSAEKGLRFVPEIQRLLHRGAVAHQLVFVGDGPLAPELRYALPDAAFLGSQPHAEVARAMASADVFLFPSTTDTFGNVVIEAQASGLPTVVANAGGPPEQVVDSETGYVVAPNDPRAFVDVLIPLLRNHGHRRAMGEAAREWAELKGWGSSMEPLWTAWQDAAMPAAVTGPVSLAPGRPIAR